MIDADHSDLPEHMRRLAKLADLRRKENGEGSRRRQPAGRDKDAQLHLRMPRRTPGPNARCSDARKTRASASTTNARNYDVSNADARCQEAIGDCVRERVSS